MLGCPPWSGAGSCPGRGRPWLAPCGLAGRRLRVLLLPRAPTRTSSLGVLPPACCLDPRSYSHQQIVLDLVGRRTHAQYLSLARLTATHVAAGNWP
jgi:hypothetical protein